MQNFSEKEKKFSKNCCVKNFFKKFAKCFFVKKGFNPIKELQSFKP